jgi:hypothetical protein
MTPIIKSFRQILKHRRGKNYKPRSKRLCYKCGKPGHFIAKCPMSSDSDRGKDKKGKNKEKKRYYKKDGIGFQQGSNVKLNAHKRLSNFVKGKAPMVQDNEGYILYPANYPEHKIRKIHARKSHSVSHHRMRHLALGIPLILNCLERKFLLHQMSIMFLLKLLIHHMCLLTNQAK